MSKQDPSEQILTLVVLAGSSCVPPTCIWDIVDMGHIGHSIYQRKIRYNFGTWILRPPTPLPKCPKFSTDQYLGFCLDPLPPFGPMSHSLLLFFEGIPYIRKNRLLYHLYFGSVTKKDLGPLPPPHQKCAKLKYNWYSNRNNHAGHPIGITTSPKSFFVTIPLIPN